MLDRKSLLNRILWIWIGGAVLFYLHQFRTLIDPVLSLLEVK